MNFDERDRQSKSLVQWEKQQKVWDQMEGRLAKKVDKHDASETLQGSIHHFRMRNEELGMIDTSVPVEVKNGINAWEMNLRSGAGGVRYVQIGSSFPYPLYCPIRDAESVKPESNNLMKVLPHAAIAKRHKPVSESAYFLGRQQEYGKFIKKRFSHFATGQEPIEIVGQKPPLSQKPVKEKSDIEPVMFVPFVPKETTTPAEESPTAAQAAAEAAESKPASRPLSAVTASNRPPSAGPQNGPMLMFSASHLTLSGAPGELAQATLVVENIGSTAVFYNWSPVADSMSDKTEHFRLSDALSGVVLPEETRHFTFSLRSPVAGVFSKQYELLTVPTGKERIIVQLRGVVLGTEGNPILVDQLDAMLATKATRDDARAVFTEVLTAASNNVLAESEMRREVQRGYEEERQREAEVLAEQTKNERLWNESNAALGLPFNKAVYDKVESLHDNYHAFLRKIAPGNNPRSAADAARGATPTPDAMDSTTNPQHVTFASRSTTPAVAASPEKGGAAAAASPVAVDPASPIAASDNAAAGMASPPTEWNGSVRRLLEDFARVKDMHVRTAFLGALNWLLKAAAHSAAPEEPLSLLMQRCAGSMAFGAAASSIEGFSVTAREMAEGKGLKARVEGKADAKGAKGGAAAKKGGPAAKGAAEPAGKAGGSSAPGDNSDGKAPADYHSYMMVGARRIVGDAVENIFAIQENANHAIEVVCDRPVDLLFARRMEQIVVEQATPDVEIELAPETTGKGKKK